MAIIVETTITKKMQYPEGIEVTATNKGTIGVIIHGDVAGSSVSFWLSEKRARILLQALTRGSIILEELRSCP